MDYRQYLRERLTSLRLEKNISEYHLSMEIGKSKTYMQTISSGKSLPSFEAFFDLCDYFEMSPAEFFTESGDSEQLRRVRHKLNALSGEDLALIEPLLDRMLRSESDEGER